MLQYINTLQGFGDSGQGHQQFISNNPLTTGYISEKRVTRK
jgi:hypothetical protein